MDSLPMAFNRGRLVDRGSQLIQTNMRLTRETACASKGDSKRSKFLDIRRSESMGLVRFNASLRRYLMWCQESGSC